MSQSLCFVEWGVHCSAAVVQGCTLPRGLPGNPPARISSLVHCWQDKNTDVVMKALVAVKDSQISAVVKGLTPEQWDTLMR